MDVLEHIGVTHWVDAWLDEGLSPLAIARKLEDKGHPVSSYTVREHARKRGIVARIKAETPAKGRQPATRSTVLERDGEELLTVTEPLVDATLTPGELVAETWDRLSLILRRQLQLVHRAQTAAAAGEPHDVPGMVKALKEAQALTQGLKPWLLGEAAAYGARVELPEPRDAAGLRHNLQAISAGIATGLIPTGQGKLLLEVVARQERQLVLEHLYARLDDLERDAPMLEGAAETVETVGEEAA